MHGDDDRGGAADGATDPRRRGGRRAAGTACCPAAACVVVRSSSPARSAPLVRTPVRAHPHLRPGAGDPGARTRPAGSRPTPPECSGLGAVATATAPPHHSSGVAPRGGAPTPAVTMPDHAHAPSLPSGAVGQPAKIEQTGTLGLTVGRGDLSADHARA